jgi:hypothetical protein
MLRHGRNRNGGDCIAYTISYTCAYANASAYTYTHTYAQPDT